jgi:SRSO17 transposase
LPQRAQRNGWNKTNFSSHFLFGNYIFRLFLGDLCTTNVQELEILLSKIDEFVGILEMRLSVIPAKAGIQFFQIVINSLDSGFHRSDDFSRVHQNWFGTQPVKSPQPPFR